MMKDLVFNGVFFGLALMAKGARRQHIHRIYVGCRYIYFKRRKFELVKII